MTSIVRSATKVVEIVLGMHIVAGTIVIAIFKWMASKVVAQHV
jgi:hypothetical protein